MEVSGFAITSLPTNDNLITDNLIINIASLSIPVKGKSSLDKLAFWLYIQNIVMKHCFELRGDTMAKQIEGVYENVLRCARREFLEKGFALASLRDIAKAAGTSTGSIYTRFTDKAGLFRALVEPAAGELKRRFLEIQESFHRFDGQTQQEEMEQAAQRKRQSILRVEYQWIMRGAQARRTKNKDRIARYEELKAQAAPETDGAVEMATLSSRLGRKTVELDHVSKAFGDHVVLRDFTYHIARDDRVGIVGRNGAGKSTLLNLIAGKLTPDSGTVDWGETVRIGYFSQEGRELDPRQRVYDFIHEVAGQVKTREGNFSATQMMERFLFPTQLQGQPIGKLSGGERRRLYLLSLLMEAPNILLLDEPTNDLDVTTLAILEEYLETFPGAVLAVSHDRYFLDKMAHQIFEVGEEGQVTRYSGNYSDYLDKRQAASAPAQEEKAEKKPAGKPARQKKLKFTFKEQREYDTIEADIAALEARIAQREGEMLACGSDYGKLQDLTKEQEADQAALEEKMERWLYLTDLAERIAAQEG